MTRIESLLLHASFTLVAATGLVYAWMLYLLEPVDEFSVVNHPWQPLLHDAHIWAAPVLVFALGLIWRQHVWSQLEKGSGERRRSGLGLLLSMVPMIASGYLLQTSVDSGWRTAWMWVHLVASGLFVAGYLGHQLSAFLERYQPTGEDSLVVRSIEKAADSDC